MRTFWIIVGLMALAAVGITLLERPESSAGDVQVVASQPTLPSRQADDEARPMQLEVWFDEDPTAATEPTPTTETEPASEPITGGVTEPAANPAAPVASVDPTEGGPADAPVADAAPEVETAEPVETDLAAADDDEPMTFMPTPESEQSPAAGPGDPTSSEGGSTSVAGPVFESLDQFIDAVQDGTLAGESLAEAVTSVVEESAEQEAAVSNDEAADEVAEAVIAEAETNTPEPVATVTTNAPSDATAASEPEQVAQASPEVEAAAAPAPAPSVAIDSYETATDGTLTIGGRWTVPGKGTQAEPYTITWDLLQSAQRTYQPRQGLNELPQWTKALQDKYVSLTGFTIPPAAGMSQDELLLMLNQWDGCCIGVPPTPYDAVEVKLREPMGLTADWLGGSAVNHGTVTGRFEVDPYEMNGWLLGLYLIKDARLGAGAPVGSP